MRPLAILLLVGCGRVAFDPAETCAVQGHDEDADGIDDGCDNCPHLANDNADQDGDGVGDACDPHIDVARDRIAWFDPFTSMRPEYIFAGPMQLFNEPPNVTCTSDYPVPRTTVMGAIPAVTPTRIDIHLNGFVAAVDYFIQIHSD